jgi:rubrerythrin
MSDSASSGTTGIEKGTVVYDHEGSEMGVITEMTSQGFEVAINVEIEDVDEDGRVDVDDLTTEPQSADESDADLQASEQKHDPGHEFGEGYLMWRCDDCGEMGELDAGLPETCPACGSDEVYKWRED